ncbi:MAG: hypothetical protein ACR2PU_05440 [Gammaproteobacteria bacterium]
MNKKQSLLLDPKIWIVICLTLGLAPFTPEPHIWEKLKWIANGANGMRAIDWFDVFLHGTPWILLFVSLFYKFKISKV